MVLPSWSIFRHVSFVLSLNPFRSKISTNLNHMLAFKNFCRKYYRYSHFAIICISVFIMPFSAIWLRIQYFLRIKCVYLTFLYCVSLNYPHIKDWKGVSYFLKLNDSENKKYSIYWGKKNMGCCVGAAASLGDQYDAARQQDGALVTIWAQGQIPKQAAFTYLIPFHFLTGPLFCQVSAPSVRGSHLELPCCLLFLRGNPLRLSLPWTLPNKMPVATYSNK